MQITQANLDALRTQFSAQFSGAYDSTQPWWPLIASEIPSSAKSNTYGWIAQQLQMRKWVGPRVALNLKEHVATVVNDPFEVTVELDRDDIEDDNLGLFAGITIPDMGQAAKKHPDQLLVTSLQANPTMWDAKALFATDHPTYAPTGATQTYQNVYTTTPLNADNFATVWTNMSAIVGENGQPLGLMPNKLFVPPQLKKTALQIMNSTTIAQTIKNIAGAENVAAAGADNVLKGWCDVEVIPELAGQGTVWYVADCTRKIKPFLYQVRRPAQFVSRVNPDDPKVFDMKVFTYGAEGRWQIAPTLPFLIARATA